MRVVGDAVAASDHCRIPPLIRETDAGRKQFLAVAHSAVSRHAPTPADQDFVGCGVIGFDPQTGGTHPVRVQLPSQSKGKGQFWCGAPPVANIETIHVLQTVHLDELAALSRNSGRAEQKPREAVPAVLKRWSVSPESDGGF